jgi:asparaginyl-tRNA synthetase
MESAEACVKAALQGVLSERLADLITCGGKDESILARVTQTALAKFAKMTYTEAVEILLKSGTKFTYPVVWGEGLASEHERFLAEKHCQGPVFVTDYPANIKPFYMKRNQHDDGRTVQAFDLLIPGIVSWHSCSCNVTLHESCIAHCCRASWWVAVLEKTILTSWRP